MLKQLLEAYKAVKAQELKQKHYDDWKKQPFTLGAAEELAKTCKVLGVKVTVTLADNSKVEFEKETDPLARNRYIEGF